MLKWLLHPSKGPTSQVYQSHPCSTNFDAPGYRLVQTCSKTTLSLEVETNAWTCCLVSQGHYVFHDFRYQFIFRDVEDNGREESFSVNWSSEYVINVIWCYYDFVVGVDGHGRTMTWLDMIWQIFCCAKSMRIIQNFSSVMEKSPTSPFNFPWTFTCTRRTSHRQFALFLALWHLRLLACVISIGTTKVSLGSWLSDVSELLSDMHHPFLSRFGCWTCWKA